MSTNDSLLPAALFPLATNVAKGCGIDDNTTTLLVCAAVALASGNATMIWSPDGRALGPAFNLAIVSNGTGFPRGALMQLAGPVTGFVEDARKGRFERGAAATRVALEAAVTRRRELTNSIAQKEAELVDVKARNAAADAIGERTRQQTVITAEEMREYRATGFDFKGETTLETSLRHDRKTLQEAEALAQVLQVEAAPGIIADEPDWSAVPNLGKDSFDGSSLVVNSTGISLLCLMNRKQMAGLARALMGTRIGRPGPTVVACAPGGTFAQALAAPAVRSAGLFATFAFVESTDAGPGNPAAIHAAYADKGWPQLCRKLYLNRVRGLRRGMELDGAGFRAFSAFCAWCRQECPAAMLPFLESWPDLCLRLALIQALMADADSVTADYVLRAADYLRSRFAATCLLIEGLVAGESPAQQRESRIDRICRRLGNGPLTKRGIVRTMHRQDYGIVESMIAEALTAGRIERHGDFFCVSSVSVSASAS